MREKIETERIDQYINKKREDKINVFICYLFFTI